MNTADCNRSITSNQTELAILFTLCNQSLMFQLLTFITVGFAVAIYCQFSWSGHFELHPRAT
jgi:hypothetical protein